MSAPVKVGDRVKVTLEGEVAGVAEAGDNGTYELRVQVDGQDHFVYTDTANIETVVEEFPPGTLVRNLDTGNLVLVTWEGYVKLPNGTHVAGKFRFTSRNYERVELP